MAPNNNDSFKCYANNSSSTASPDTSFIEEEKKVDSGIAENMEIQSYTTNHHHHRHQNAKCLNDPGGGGGNEDDCKPPAATTKHEPQAPASYGYTFPPTSHGSTTSSHYLSTGGIVNGGKRKLPSKGSGEPDTEAGLELLFAASLIQQKDESNKQKQQQQQQEALAAAHPPTPGAKAISSCSENESAAGDSPCHTSVAMELAGEASSPNNNNNTDQTVEEPGDRDVLCGRGGFINKHVGNIIYRKVVDYNKAIYKQVPKRHRILVSQSIVHTIEKHGGRFLQPVSGQGRKNQTWTCIQFRRAVQKTSQALREPTTETPDLSALCAAAGESMESERSNKSED